MSLVAGSILNAFFLFCIVAVLSMMVTYIVQLKGKLAKIIFENVCLFDKMHEGIIVVSQHDLSLQFASRPAIDLLLQQPNANFKRSIEILQHHPQTVSRQDLQKPIFEPIVLSVDSI